MPLHRRIPKRGFHNPFGREFAIINVAALNTFSKGDVVNPDVLLSRGILSSGREGVKVLGDGELKVALTVQAHAFSKSAEQKIAAAGGKVERLS
jgi:large subunit ribosomal protein L15